MERSEPLAASAVQVEEAVVEVLVSASAAPQNAECVLRMQECTDSPDRRRALFRSDPAPFRTGRL